MRTRGFRRGRRKTIIPCEKVPSGRHSWERDAEYCVRCGRSYEEVTKNTYNKKQSARRKYRKEKRQEIKTLQDKISNLKLELKARK